MVVVVVSFSPFPPWTIIRQQRSRVNCPLAARELPWFGGKVGGEAKLAAEVLHYEGGPPLEPPHPPVVHEQWRVEGGARGLGPV